MMTDPSTEDDLALESVFRAAREDRPIPDPGFMARLAADAEAMTPRTTPARPSRSRRAFNPFAGIFAASSLTGAAALGLWIGFVMPESATFLTAFPATDEGFSLSEFLPATDLALLAE